MNQTVFTIGYEGSDIERFVTTLVEAGIQTVADVRAVALSRKRGFSKTALRAALSNTGIEYRHFVQLGDPREGRDAARAGDYVRFRAIYSQHMRTGDACAALGDLVRLTADVNVCLMCFEYAPEGCHRSMIATELQARGMAVTNLYCPSATRPIRHADLLPRHDPGQGAAAPE